MRIITYSYSDVNSAKLNILRSLSKNEVEAVPASVGAAEIVGVSDDIVFGEDIANLNL